MRLIIFALLICILLLPSAVSAHGEFESSVPAAGAVVAEVDQIALRFTEPVLSANGFLLKENTQYSLAFDRLEDGGLTAIGRVDGELEAGVYQVVWSAQADDEHQISGSFSFELAPETNNTLIFLAGFIVINVLAVVVTVWFVKRRQA